ncbi:hypothetical protein GW796_00420 [archaeon]|nr:hypothetical protein [archaeon]
MIFNKSCLNLFIISTGTFFNLDHSNKESQVTHLFKLSIFFSNDDRYKSFVFLSKSQNNHFSPALNKSFISF